jgi:DHA1 family tetracycline resistance protein-like MFS transporter
LNSLTGVLAPIIAATLLTTVSGRPSGDVWLGLPFFFCAVLSGLAAFVAIRHFLRRRGTPAAAAAAP